MNYMIFFIYQFILVSTLFIINFYVDSYIGKPFTRVDLLAICIQIPIFILLINLISKLYSRFSSIRLRTKIFLSILAVLAVILATLVISVLWNN
ncbi:hypothetical protein FZC66_17535 [Priestia megaterium]|nr:hypothetical protein FZC66_17535 [Priestia megaterium]